MKIGVFDPYLDTLSGGERYMLTAASCLSADHSVDVFWDDKQVLENAEIKFALDLKKVNITKNIFVPGVPILKRLSQTGKYDVIFYLSDGSIPVIASKKTILHFQFPVEWLHLTLKTRLKLKRVHSVICNSFFTKELIDKKFNIKSKVIYPPVHLFPKEPYSKKRKYYSYRGQI